MLVVEDDADQRALLETLLAEDGHEVRQARTGREGLELVSSWRPHIVVLDIQLGDMDGRTFRAEQAKLDGAADVPVILVSATHERLLSSYAAEVGASIGFAKPFDVEALLSAIGEYCRKE